MCSKIIFREHDSDAYGTPCILNDFAIHDSVIPSFLFQRHEKLLFDKIMDSKIIFSPMS
jgi:hypothetical protein